MDCQSNCARIEPVTANIAACLNQLARQVNFVWNYSNALCFQHLQRTGKFFSAFDLHAYTKGTSKAGLDLHSQSIQAINEELVLRRKQFKKAKLRWRISGGSRKSLGWIPFKASAY
jgi:putative transposase